MDGPGRLWSIVRVCVVVERVFGRQDKVMIAELRPLKKER